MPLAVTWRVHPIRIPTVKYWVDLESISICPIRSFSYGAGPETRDMKKSEIGKILALNVIDRAQAEWASPVVFASKKDRTLHLYVY